jgi:hypothetical protein
MANIAQGSTAPAQEAAPPPGGPQGTGQEINLDELTTEQAFGFITNAVRSQPFNYMEHVQLEQARGSVATALGLTEGAQ